MFEQDLCEFLFEITSSCPLFIPHVEQVMGFERCLLLVKAVNSLFRSPYLDLLEH